MSLYLGHVVEFSVGPYSSYTLLAALSLALSALFFLFLWFMVESPHELVRRGDWAGARAALRWLRKTSDLDVLEREMKEVEVWVERQAAAGLVRVGATLRAWRPLIVVCGVAIAQRLTGMSAVTAYASSTFPSTQGGLNADQYSILFALVVFLTSFVSAALVDTAGRRPVLLASCAGCGASHLLTAYYFFHPSPKATFLPFVTISSFAIFYSFGLGPLPDTLKGELLPADARLLGSAIITICHGLSSMAVTKLFQVIKDDLYVYVNFLIFATSCCLSFLLSYKLVPETKSKTLSEVQEHLSSQS